MTERVVKPFLEICKDPKSNVHYFSSCLYDENVKEFSKNNDQIDLDCQLKNLEDFNLPNLNLYVAVSLTYSSHDFSNDNTIFSDFHPYLLKCSNIETRLTSKMLLDNNSSNCFLFKLDKETMRCTIKDLNIIIPSNEQILENYENHLIKITSIDNNNNPNCSSEYFDTTTNVDEEKTGNTFDNKITMLKRKIENHFWNNYDLNVCRLKLQVIIHDLNKNKLENYITEPIYTPKIHNTSFSKQLTKIYTNSSLNNLDNLRIIRFSRINGSINGGDEIFIFTSYFNPSDIEVEFIQFKNYTEIAWRAFAFIDKTDIHSNCALIIKTPKYLITNDDEVKTNKKTTIKVYFRLFKPSTKEYSEKCVFYYTQNDLLEFKSLFSESLSKESRLINKLNNGKDVNSCSNSLISSKYKRKNESKVSESRELEGKSHNKKTTKKIKIDDSENDDSDGEVTETEDMKKLDDLINPSNSSMDNNESEDFDIDDREVIHNNNDSNISVASSTSISSLIVRNLNLDANRLSTEVQTLISYPPDKILNTLEAKFELKREEIARATPLEHQLKLNLDNCISKMNALADRTGKALIKFSKTRSFHELLKTQRFLINVQDEDGNTPIHLSILYGNFDLLEIFVDVALTIPYQNLINLKNHKNLTPLLMASMVNEVEVCEFLLEANADLTHTDLNGNNVVHIACKNKNLNLLKSIIKYIDKTCSYGVLNCTNHDGYSPLHLAVLSESIDLVRELLYLKYLKINIQDKRAGYSALHHSATKPNLLEICKLLVKNENIDINLRAFNGCTPLHIAIANKNYLITCLLISNNADLYIKSDMPLHNEAGLYELAVKKHNTLKRAIEMGIEHFKSSNNSSLKSESTLIDKHVSIELTDVRLSQEIKKIYDQLDENGCIDNEEMKEFNIRYMSSQHNYDSYHYAQNDEWMLEIFKDSKSIKRDLLEKIICFETYRKLYFELQNFVLPTNNLTGADFDNLMKDSKNSIIKMEKKSCVGQIKISQQATMEDNDEFMII